MCFTVFDVCAQRLLTVQNEILGDVLHFDMLCKNIIVLGSLTIVRDLLNERSANYSDITISVMLPL